MKLSPAIFLALGFAVSGAAPLYAADSSGHPQSPSSTSPGMTDGAQKNYQDALDNCNKKTGASKSNCMKKAAEEKCKDMTGKANSTCMKNATSSHPGSSGNASGMKRHQDGRATDMPGGAPMEGPTGGSSGQPGSQMSTPDGSPYGSPTGSPSGSPSGSSSGSPSGSSSGSPSGSTSGSGSY